MTRRIGEESMSDRVALVTGATSGVGRVVAERLGAAGWRVLAHGRDSARGAEVVATITAAGGQARFLHADLASLAGVRALAAAVAQEGPRLPLLINNAGIGFGPPGAPRELGADGFELRLAVNYLAPFLLTRLLLPDLRAAAPRASSMSPRSGSATSISAICISRGAIAAWTPIASPSSRSSC
jgi:NAD(P)-dependent dehydrogenase (short-subunit alcohol dehydrogenase family)